LQRRTRRVQQGAVGGRERRAHQIGQRRHVAAGAVDGREAGVARGLGGGVAHAEGFGFVRRAEPGPGAHAIGRGEQHRAHAAQIDARGFVEHDVEQRGLHRIVAASGQHGGEGLGLAARTGHQNVEAAFVGHAK
jgi:hypothetical protein